MSARSQYRSPRQAPRHSGPALVTLKPLAWACALVCATPLAQAQQASTAVAKPPVQVIEIIGSTPIDGSGLLRSQMAAPVQTATDENLQRSTATDLPDYISRRLGSVHVNDIQGNPLQMDISFRGYTASPLLGTPQGLSIYVDGVRQNQPFGDVVSWDLIPKAAIANMELMPGSNPLFGLNTLGGALSVQTKDGLTHPGISFEGSVGSHGRLSGEASAGGVMANGIDYFVTANQLLDDGWRQDSPSDVTQAFGKFGWKDGVSRATISAAASRSALTGNGLQEQRFLDRDWTSVYTVPDQTNQSSAMVNAAYARAFGEHNSFNGNVYARYSKTSTLNADINDDSLDQSVYQLNATERAALTSAGYTGFPTGTMNAANTPFPYWRCIAQALLNDEPGEKCNGQIGTSQTDQHTLGANAQWTFKGDWFGLHQTALFGGTAETSQVHFVQNVQLGYLNPDRTVTAIPGLIEDGVHAGNVDGDPLDARVDLRSSVRTLSVFAADTLRLGDALHLSLSGRYNRVQVDNRDQIVAAPDPTSLDGNYTFKRFNPAIGLTWSPSQAFTGYAGYASSSRAPTAIELGCANEDNPCKLPNAMAGDRQLRQVVTRTVELGARGRLDGMGGSGNWRLGVFRGENTDDILFVSSTATGYGYFKNFGKTRRQGLEAGFDYAAGPLDMALNYTWLQATYQSTETLLGSGNSSNDAGPGLDGNITVQPGDRMPLIPRHILKASAGWKFNEQWSVEGEVIGISSSLARGNENNQHQPDGTYYLGKGYSAGYGLFNLGAAWRPQPGLKLFARVDNLFDRRYTTAAQLGNTGFNAAGNFVARPFAKVGDDYPLVSATFYAPGAPRALILGVRYEFGGCVPWPPAGPCCARARRPALSVA